MRDHLTKGFGLMDVSEVVNRVITAIMLATLTGLGGAVLAAQSDVPTTGGQGAYPEPDRVGTLDSDLQGPTISGRTKYPTGRPEQGFVITELDVTPGAWPPGSSQLRWLRITNPNDVDIMITRLSATVGLPKERGRSHPVCLPSDLAVEPLGKLVTVPASGSVDVALVARLTEAAPPSCIDAEFPLTYSGVAATP